MRRAVGLWATLALAFTLGAPVAVAAGAPLPGPVWTTGVDTDSAGLHAELDPAGEATTYHFSYLTRSAYEANLSAGRDGFSGAAKAPSGPDPTLAAGSGAVAVARPVAGLSPDTEYRLRLEASNGSGSAVSAAITFRSGAPGSTVFMLDSRGWEMVSPPDKGGGGAQGPGGVFGGGVVQAAAGGAAITYSSSYSFGAGAPAAPAGSQYVSRRGASGWETADVTAPSVGGAYGPSPEGVPYQLLSPDLARGLMLDGLCADGAPPCRRRYSLREPGGAVLATSAAEPDLRLAGATPDLSQRILSTCAALTAEAVAAPGPDGCDPTQPNLYRWSAAGLALVNLLPGATEGTPGATLAAPAGAVAADGGRVYFTDGGNLYLREGANSKQVDAAAGGGGTFEAAADSGAVAYFSKDDHLYRYDAAGAGTITDLTPAGGLLGVLGCSADGEWVYYLTGAGLLLRHGAGVVEVAAEADADNYPPATGVARVSLDGRHLAFVATLSLTGFDNRERGGGAGGGPGAPLSEVYLYDAADGRLTCASCNPYGEEPLGPATIPGTYADGSGPWATRAYKPRALSADGRRLFFDSGDDLALRDKDRSPARTDPDVYEWEAQGEGSCQSQGGCVALISDGRTLAGASFLDASANGDDAFFLTADSLVGEDGGFPDVYDARVGGGFPEPERPIACVGDACQFLPSEPEDPQPGTLVPGAGNPPPAVVTVRAPRPKCRKGKVRRKGRCVRKQRRKVRRHKARRHHHRARRR